MSNSSFEDPTVDDAPILHIDLDAFFASVEVLDDPSLKGRCVAVGGAGARGVIASATYEARRYGVRSGMASSVARRRCPSLVILAGRLERYEAYSRDFRAIVNDLTPDVEPLGLDEVFADLRSLRRLDVHPLSAARALRARLRDELSLDSGVGIGRNKLFAKLASKRAKPQIVEGRLVEGPGVVWVSPTVEARWLEELPVRALWGVGPATAAKLERLGLRYVRDLKKVDHVALSAHLGPAMARTLLTYAEGEDLREVVVDRVAKSIGHDQTFAVSLVGPVALADAARHHAGVVARSLRDQHLVSRTISVVVRFDDMTSVSRAQTLSFGVDDEVGITALAAALLATIPLDRSVRLLGLYASSFLDRDDNDVQLRFGLEEVSDERARALEVSQGHQVTRAALRDAIDEVRQKFGRSALAHASELREGEIDVTTQRGRHAFGPEADSGEGV